VGTLALQFCCAFIRAMVAYVILWLVFTIGRHSTAPVNTLALVVAYGPLVLSFATLILPLGGWWWEQQSGGRSPSERERLVFEDAMTTLTHHDPDLRPRGSGPFGRLRMVIHPGAIPRGDLLVLRVHAVNRTVTHAVEETHDGAHEKGLAMSTGLYRGSVPACEEGLVTLRG
jgi:hypothetical protein